MAINEIIVQYEGRVKETITVPGKPIPIGFKVWAVAQRGFLILWNWYVPGEKNGPVRVRTPKELGGTIRDGNRGNKIQVVILHLINRFPKPL